MHKIVVFETSDIALRRTIPAILKSDYFAYGGFAIATDLERNKIFKGGVSPSKERIDVFLSKFGGKRYNSFSEALSDPDVFAVYLPLPPGLHYYWAKEALLHRKHLLIEKPFVFNRKEAEELIDLAKSNNVSIHVNYAFLFHKQIRTLFDIINDSTKFGELRSLTAHFGFPYRGDGDFRYDKYLGGGALFDCGCYPLLFIDKILGGKTRVMFSHLYLDKKKDSNLFGEFVLQSKNDGHVGFGSFGMDNCYRCDIDVWGNKGIIKSYRLFSPRDDFPTSFELLNSMGERTSIDVGCDDQFLHSLEYFEKTIESIEERFVNFKYLLHQTDLLEQITLGKKYEKNN